MGLSEATLKALSDPCTACIHDTNKYCLDNMSIDSQCSECCQLHIRTHAHNEESEESEEEENGELQ